jgi:prepilin-type N-terminal cleavage/methylation domain-containing protein
VFSTIFLGEKMNTMISRPSNTMQGFTLSELLVSLAVLGLIAAFAIPKVLSAVNEAGIKAVGKEAISMVSSSFDSLRADSNGFLPKSTTAAQLAAKMNFVNLATTTTGSVQGQVMNLHNGGRISYDEDDNFTGGTNGFIRFNIDPDGAASSGAISVNLGYDGRVWVDNELYKAGTGSTVSAFNASYTSSTPGEIAATVPASAVGTDTTWFNW